MNSPKPTSTFRNELDAARAKHAATVERFSVATYEGDADAVELAGAELAACDALIRRLTGALSVGVKRDAAADVDSARVAVESMSARAIAEIAAARQLAAKVSKQAESFTKSLAELINGTANTHGELGRFVHPAEEHQRTGVGSCSYGVTGRHVAQALLAHICYELNFRSIDHSGFVVDGPAVLAGEGERLVRALAVDGKKLVALAEKALGALSDEVAP